MESNKSFTIKLLYITVIMEVLSFGWKFFMPEEFVSPTILVLPVFFLAITLIIHSYLAKTFEQRFQNFLNRYLVVTTIKLLGLLGIMAIYVFTYTDDVVNFVVTLFVNYIVFTLFEARALIMHGKK